MEAWLTSPHPSLSPTQLTKGEFLISSRDGILTSLFPLPLPQAEISLPFQWGWNCISTDGKSEVGGGYGQVKHQM